MVMTELYKMNRNESYLLQIQPSSRQSIQLEGIQDAGDFLQNNPFQRVMFEVMATGQAVVLGSAETIDFRRSVFVVVGVYQIEPKQFYSCLSL